MIVTRTRPTRSIEGNLRHRATASVAGARTFSEAPIGWSILIGGSLFGVYLMTTGGMGAVNGAMVTTLSLVAGSGAVFVGA